MKSTIIIRAFLTITVLAIFSHSNAFASLILDIDLNNQSFDWVDGSSITRVPNTVEHNGFGSFSSINATITSPLPLYSGNGSFIAVYFDFSDDFTSLDGLAFATTAPPGQSATFSGTNALPSLATFSVGDFSIFANLSAGSFDFASMENNWNDVVTVNVSSTPVPEPTTMLLFGVGLLSFAGVNRRKR